MSGSDNLEDKTKVLNDEDSWTRITDSKVRTKAIVRLQMKQPYYNWIEIQCGIKTKALFYSLPPRRDASDLSPQPFEGYGGEQTNQPAAR